MEENNFTRKVTQDNFATEQVDIVQNNLLGFYDDNGTYCITPQIIDELLALPKIKKSNFHNSLFCVGNLLGFGEIAFELEYDKKLDDKECAKATLYVLEEVEKINGYLQNTIKTKVGEFNNPVNNFMEASYEYFNVSLDNSTDATGDEGMERSILDDIEDQDSFILAKKQFTLQLDKLANDKCLDAYGKYFTYRYSALSKMNNAFSQAVIELFEEEYARIEKIFLKDKNYKMLNELLDKCIEEISGTSENYIAQEKEYEDLIASALENFSDSIKSLHEKLSNKALNMLGKNDRKKMEDIMEAEDYHNHHNDNVVETPITPLPTNEMSEELIEEPVEESVMQEVNFPSFQESDEPQVSMEEEQVIQNLFTAPEPVSAPEPSQPTATQAYIESKVLDTNRTNEYDDSIKETEEVDALSNLQARVGRLSAMANKGDVAKEPAKTDDFVHNEVESYLSSQIKSEIPEEKIEEIKSKPRSFGQLFNYLNEQNKLKRDEIALRNQRNRELHNNTQENITHIDGRDY